MQTISVSNSQTERSLYYYNARWYDPTLGRFITEDPAKDGQNWFIYCGNNPLTRLDPTGLDFFDDFDYNDDGDVVYAGTDDEVTYYDEDGNEDDDYEDPYDYEAQTNDISYLQDTLDEVAEVKEELQKINDLLNNTNYRTASTKVGSVIGDGLKTTSVLSHALSLVENFLSYTLQCTTKDTRNGVQVGSIGLSMIEDFKATIDITVYTQNNLSISENTYSYSYSPGLYEEVNFSTGIIIDGDLIGVVASVDYESKFTDGSWNNHESLGDISEY